MNHPHDEQPGTTGSPDPIVPVRFDDPERQGSTLPFGRPSPIKRIVVICASIALFFAVLSVIFVLPRYVGSDTSPPDAAPVAVGETAPDSAPTVVKDIPSAEESTELRRNNQAQLESLIARTEALREKNVTQWAGTEFDEVLASIRAGEKAYAEQRYGDAGKSYEGAARTLTEIESRVEQVFKDALDEGFLYLAKGQSGAATKAFEFALSIDPDNSEAQSGLQRAGSLDQVLALINEAQGYEDLGDLDAALGRFRQAQALDSKAPGAAAAIARIEDAQRDAKFRASMSAGLTAYDANKDTQARAAFEQALKIKPGAKEAQSALAQVNNRILVNQISHHLGRAAGFEQAEKWRDAAAEFRQAARLDAELEGAATSARKADERAKLDEQLESYLAKPERLGDDAVSREATAVLARARSLPNAGARLNSQIAQLNRAITLARTPVEVTLVSDNATEVTLYKVGKLGRFTNRTVSVIPGRYVAVGRRDGFRDVRVEFKVDAQSPSGSVIVRCEQELAFGR